MSSPDKIPPIFQKGVFEASTKIPELDQVILAAHVNLDGDALGSLCAMADILKKQGKQCFIYSSTGIPDYLDFLTLPCPLCTDLNYPPFTPQGAIYLDCSEPERLGKKLAEVYADWPSINVDHHLGEGGLGSLANCIYPQAAATAQLVAYIAMALNIPLTANLGESIGIGLITDTGSFCHGNTSAAVFELCATLINNGCDLHALREKLYNNWPIAKLRLWGSQFLNVEFLLDRQLAFCIVSLHEIKKYHCKSEDLEGLVEKFRNIKNVRISALLREENEHLCKFSLRSSGNVDVQKIALKAGGGGHMNAAGGTLALPLPEARNVLFHLLEEELKSYF